MNKLLMQMIGIESRATMGAPVLLSGLRERLPGMSKANFEQDVLDLARSRKYFLTRHYFPESLSDQEKEMMISAGEGDFFYEINLSAETGIKSSMKGRMPVPELLRREQFGRSIRLPKWIVEWLRAEGNAGKKIEAALIGYYGLTSPE
jgi:predicted ATPase